VLQLLVTVKFVPSSFILFTLLMEAIIFSETSIPTRFKRRRIQEDGILRKILDIFRKSQKFASKFS
jgi:hypothetical protein